jgi:hypothetical protein
VPVNLPYQSRARRPQGDLSQIKAGYGCCNVQIKYDGDARFLQEASG